MAAVQSLWLTSGGKNTRGARDSCGGYPCLHDPIYNNSWFSTVWGISNFLRQFSGPKTYRANRDRKKRGRKKTPTYLHFSVLLTRAGHIFKTHLQNEYSFPLFTFKILHAALYPPCCSLCSANHDSSSEQPSLLWTSASLPPIQLQIGLNH